MKSLSLPNYKEIQKALNKTPQKLHPSQVHGIMCGLICGKAQAQWQSVLGMDHAHNILHALYQASVYQFSEVLFELELSLPKDNVALPIRAEALTLWCQGFLSGLKTAQVPIHDRAPSDSTEAIHDLIEIAKMKYEDVVASEEDEEAYVELVEFVRAAAILIYEDLCEVAKLN